MYDGSWDNLGANACVDVKEIEPEYVSYVYEWLSTGESEVGSEYGRAEFFMDMSRSCVCVRVCGIGKRDGPTEEKGGTSEGSERETEPATNSSNAMLR
eukprot:8187135-Pyramimonas_sp.AAC.1